MYSNKINKSDESDGCLAVLSGCATAGHLQKI